MGMPMRIGQALVNSAWGAFQRVKAIPAGTLSTVSGTRGGWLALIQESFTSAWQHNVTISVDTALTYSAVYRCISLISSDVAKMRVKLVAEDGPNIWAEVKNSAHSPVLRKPNSYQTRIQFFTNWLESKLIHGNTYVLKERDARNVVVRLHVLNPRLVSVLVAPDSSVFYDLQTDELVGLRAKGIVVPASEIIHDRGPTFQHPLVGLSPISAASLAALQGLNIQKNSATFFSKGSHPGGVLSAPGQISEEAAIRLKTYWDENYGTGGPNVGNVAVLGDGLKYEPMMMTATDSQLLEQLKMTAEIVASVFGVPAYMIGVGTPPSYNNIEALSLQYYSQGLQIHIESIELALDEGLELKKDEQGRQLGTEFDLDGLLRMDTATMMDVAQKAMTSGLSPDEIRMRFHGAGPVKGGNSPYLQQQYYSLEALAERDQDKPFAKPAAPPPTAPAAPAASNAEEDADGGNDQGRALAAYLYHRSAKFDARDAA